MNVSNTVVFVVNMLVMLFAFANIAFFLLYARRNALTGSYIWFQSLIFTFSFLEVAMLYSQVESYWAVKHGLTYFKLWPLGNYNQIFIGLSWLLFCLNFSESKLLKKKAIVFTVAAVPILIFVLMLIPQTRYLYFNHRSPSILFFVHCLEGYVYAIWGTVALLLFSIKQFGYKKVQGILMIFVIILPMGIHLVQDITVFAFKKELFIKNLGLVTPAFLLSTIIVAFATFKYRFLNVVTLAQKTLLRTMPYPILVLDANNKIVDYNTAFLYRFSSIKKLKLSDHIGIFTESIRKYIDASSDKEIRTLDALRKSLQATGELSLSHSLTDTNRETEFYDVRIEPITLKGAVVGKIITFVNITEYKKLMSSSIDKEIQMLEINQELVEASSQIAEYAKLIKDLLNKSHERNEDQRNIPDVLTGRDIEIISQIVQGKSSKEIAGVLGLSDGTVRNRISGILNKLNLADRTQLATFALENQII